MVERAQLWQWGSLWAVHGEEAIRALLSPWPVERPANWTARVNAPLTAKELDRVRVSIERGRPYGADDWVRRTVSDLGLVHSQNSDAGSRQWPEPAVRRRDPRPGDVVHPTGHEAGIAGVGNSRFPSPSRVNVAMGSDLPFRSWIGSSPTASPPQPCSLPMGFCGLSRRSSCQEHHGGHVGRVGHHFGSDVASISTSMPISLKSVLTALSIALSRTPV